MPRPGRRGLRTTMRGSVGINSAITGSTSSKAIGGGHGSSRVCADGMASDDKAATGSSDALLGRLRQCLTDIQRFQDHNDVDMADHAQRSLLLQTARALRKIMNEVAAAKARRLTRGETTALGSALVQLTHVLDRVTDASEWMPSDILTRLINAVEKIEAKQRPAAPPALARSRATLRLLLQRWFPAESARPTCPRKIELRSQQNRIQSVLRALSQGQQAQKANHEYPARLVSNATQLLRRIQRDGVAGWDAWTDGPFRKCMRLLFEIHQAADVDDSDDGAKRRHAVVISQWKQQYARPTATA